MKQGQFDTEQKALKEVKKRIRKIFSEVLSSKCNSCPYIANGNHSISFTIQTKDGYLTGEVGIRAN